MCLIRCGQRHGVCVPGPCLAPRVAWAAEATAMTMRIRAAIVPRIALAIGPDGQSASWEGTGNPGGKARRVHTQMGEKNSNSNISIFCCSRTYLYDLPGNPNTNDYQHKLFFCPPPLSSPPRMLVTLQIRNMLHVPFRGPDHQSNHRSTKSIHFYLRASLQVLDRLLQHRPAREPQEDPEEQAQQEVPRAPAPALPAPTGTALEISIVKGQTKSGGGRAWECQCEREFAR